MHEPPVQSDCCALSGNYRLESNPERHAKAPLAAATGNWFRGVSLEVMRRLRLNWKDKFWWLRSSKPVTSVQRVSSSENLRKTALQGGFFVSRARDYDATERISRRSFTIMEIYPTRAYRMHIVIKGVWGPTVRKRTVSEKWTSEKSISRQYGPLNAIFRLKRHHFEGIFLCLLCFDISDSYITNVRFRSIGLQTPSLYVLAYSHAGNFPIGRWSSISYYGLIKNRMFEDLKQ